jgi:hypothetical protein
LISQSASKANQQLHKREFNASSQADFDNEHISDSNSKAEG